MASTPTSRHKPKKSLTENVQSRLREIMRAKGYRRKVLWLPDTSKPQFISSYKAQLETISAHVRELEDGGLLPITEEDLPGWV